MDEHTTGSTGRRLNNLLREYLGAAMNQTANFNQPANQRWTMVSVGILVFVLGVIAHRVLIAFEPTSTADFVTQEMLRRSAPIELTVQFRPSMTQTLNATNGQIQNYEGPIEYRFVNRSPEAIKVAFPPSRCFGFGSNYVSIGSEDIPFPREPRVVELKPGESVSIEEKYGVSLTGASHPFLRGGLGPFAFVFSRPSGATTDDGYLVGTVFGVYSVQLQTESK
ncbi:MAG: hypothetical protein JNM18_14575 [Planctomycetaceae bacterium]|nr:hypothetical protein [Planctomycetaceae bacterium]